MADNFKNHSTNLNNSRRGTHKNAYALFVEFCKEKYEASDMQSLKLPHTSNRWTIFIKHCMDLWNNMTEEEKLPFQEAANEICSDEIVHPAKKEQQVKKHQHNCVKRPLSPYYFYCEDHRKEFRKQHPEYSLAEIALKLGTDWCAASVGTKQKYEQMAQLDYYKFIENYY